MLTCQKCRALLPSGTKECPYCGTDSRWVEAPSEAQDAKSTTRFGLWIIGINAAIFLLMVMLDPAKADRDGMFSPSYGSFLMFGWAWWHIVDACGQYWRIFASMFLHADLFHLLMNSYGLYYLTPIAASTFGVHRTVFIYFGAGIVGGAASHLLGNSGLGASGAVCGLIAASAAYGYRRGGLIGRALSRRMITWGAIILVYGYLMPRIDNAGHIGGFVGGGLLGWVGAGVRARGMFADRVWRTLAHGAIVLALVVGALYWAPNLMRGFERREMQVWGRQAYRTLGLVDVIVAGDKTARLPESFSPGPEGSEAVHEAVSSAMSAARAGDPAAAQVAKLARDRMAAWQSVLFCAYGLTPKDLR